MTHAEELIKKDRHQVRMLLSDNGLPNKQYFSNHKTINTEHQ